MESGFGDGGRVGDACEDVFADGAAEEVGFLGDEGDVLAVGLEGDGGDVGVVEVYGTGVDRVESGSVLVDMRELVRGEVRGILKTPFEERDDARFPGSCMVSG